jgi:hypothetical protein
VRHIIFSASCLAALRPGHDFRPALDEIAALGFTAVRVFAGRLGWCGQEPHHALERLPEFISEAHARGLNGHVVALTDTAGGGREAYDRRQHAAEVAARVTPFDILEWANEAWHPSQHDCTPAFLASLPRPAGVPIALGASQHDEPPKGLDYAGADYVTVHLDRGRDEWNMVRRVKEVMEVGIATGKPVMSGEPIGAGEHHEAGKRLTNPAIFFTMAALGQLFNVSTCFHSSDGLMAQRLGPRQRACAEAFIRGMRAVPAARYDYKNVTHSGSPIVSATFNDGDVRKPGCTRSYSGVVGGVGVNVTLGISDMNHPGADIGNGWRWEGERAREQGVIVREVAL